MVQGEKIIYLIYLSLSNLNNDNNNHYSLILFLDWQKAEDNPNVVHITFLSESNDEFHGMADSVGPYMVVESTAFYESYKHVLSGLQKMAVALQDNRNSFPFDRYIVQ